MVQPYYTDPRIAGYMHETFGIRFVENFEISEVYIDGRLSKETHPARLTIHPDSLSLLDPQVGDLVQEGEEAYIVAPDHHEYRGRSQFLTVADAIGMTVVQRSGLPFHWPES